MAISRGCCLYDLTDRLATAEAIVDGPRRIEFGVLADRARRASGAVAGAALCPGDRSDLPADVNPTLLQEHR